MAATALVTDKHISGGEFTCVLNGVPASFANGLRRVLLGDCPRLRLGPVHIHTNTSTIANEVLTVNLGLLPLMCDPRGEVPKLRFSLNATGPAWVTASQFMVSNKDDPDATASLGDATSLGYFPPDPDNGDTALICVLTHGQTLRLTADVSLDPEIKAQVSLCAHSVVPDREAAERALGVLLQGIANDIEAAEMKKTPRPSDDLIRRRIAQAQESRRALFWTHDYQEYPKKDTWKFAFTSIGILPPQVLFEYALTRLDALVAKFVAEAVPVAEEALAVPADDDGAWRSWRVAMPGDHKTPGYVLKDAILGPDDTPLQSRIAKFVSFDILNPGSMRTSSVLRMCIRASADPGEVLAAAAARVHTRGS